jgi:hypothetical protein
VTFTDAQLQKCYDRNFTDANDGSESLRQIHALMGVYEWFQMLEGQHSPRVHEVVDHLLLPEVRAGLREWYQRPGTATDSASVEFRNQLNRLAGEQLEVPSKILHNSSV